MEESAGSGVSDVSALLQQLTDSGESATGFCASQAHNGLAKTNIIIAAITLCHQTVTEESLTCLNITVKFTNHHGLPLLVRPRIIRLNDWTKAG